MKSLLFNERYLSRRRYRDDLDILAAFGHNIVELVAMNDDQLATVARAAPLEVFLTRLYSPHSGLDYALMKRLPIDVLTNFFAFMVGEDPAPYLAAGEPGKEAVEIKFQQEMDWYGSLPVGDRELICEHFNETRDFTAAKRLLMYGDVIH